MGKQDNVTWSGQTQSISTSKNDCTAVQFASTPELLKLTPIGGDLGEVKDGFGIQSMADGSGEPCGRAEADDSEEISVSLGSALHQYLMTAIDVDLELKFNAEVTIIFKHNGVEVARVENWSGMGGSDDGPDSKDGDNFRFNSENNNVQSIVDEYFDEVVFKPTAGAISLEGGADGTKNGLLAATGSSQFEIERVFDGEIDCVNPVDIGSAASDTTYGTVTMQSQDQDPSTSIGWQSTECIKKPFDAATLASAIAFVPELADTQARYTMTITVEDQLITVADGTNPSIPAGTITSLIAEYNTAGDLSFPDASTDPLQSCTFDPEAEAMDDSDFWTQDSPIDNGTVNLLPPGEVVCFYHASVTPTGLDSESNQLGDEFWKVYFEDDPGFSFR